MKKKIAIIIILILLLLSISVGCLPSESVYVHDTPAISVEVTNNVTTSGNVSINGVGITEGRLDTMSQPYLYAIAEGNIAGHTSWTKLGYNPSSTATQSTLWELSTEYIFPIVQQQMQVVSTSASDNATGSGARAVLIYYLDSAGTEHSEIVTMTGTVPVNTVATDIYRINYFYIYTFGGSTGAAGTITVKDITGTTTYALISAGYTRGRNIVYTVPKGKVLYITSIACSAGYKTSGKTVRFTLQATYDPVLNVLLSPTYFIPDAEIVLMDNAYQKELEIPIRFPALADIKVSVIGETLAQCTCALRGWLELE